MPFVMCNPCPSIIQSKFPVVCACPQLASGSLTMDANRVLDMHVDLLTNFPKYSETVFGQRCGEGKNTKALQR
jgi:hypothetical protein